MFYNSIQGTYLPALSSAYSHNNQFTNQLIDKKYYASNKSMMGGHNYGTKTWVNPVPDYQNTLNQLMDGAYMQQKIIQSAYATTYMKQMQQPRSGVFDQLRSSYAGLSAGY